MKLSVLKPGLLVSLKTSVRGAVNYQRHEIEPEHTEEGGEKVARWETVRRIPDPVEFEAATTVRSKARSRIVSVCCTSSFGLLCPNSQEAELAQAIEDARAMTDAFNDAAHSARVDVFVLAGRVAHDEAEAVRAISSELGELMEAMKAAIKAADPEAIRAAANKARDLGAMLTPEAGKRVADAIVEARRAARELVARVSKAGEEAAQVVADLPTRAIDAARFTFLDMEAATVTHEAPAARGLDLPAEDAPTTRAAPQLAFPALEALPGGEGGAS